jgi:hypothetical protein
MNANKLQIAAAVVVVGLLLALVSTAAFLFFLLAAMWFGLYFGARATVRWWKQRLFLEEAQSVSRICDVDYFRRVSGSQLESWLLAALTARGYVLLGDPVLGRSHGQGCAWRAGKRVGLWIQQERQLSERDLASLAALKKKCKVDALLVLSPFSVAPKCHRPELEILAGQEFLAWMSVLDGVRPVNVDSIDPQNCSCGGPREQSVSRAGRALLRCSRYPDCREPPVAWLDNVANVAVSPAPRPISTTATPPTEPPPFLF